MSDGEHPAQPTMRVVPPRPDESPGDPLAEALEQTAWALGGLKERLAQATSGLEEARFTTLAEEELGRLFLRAQAYADAAIAEAEARARQLVAGAEERAERIVATARAAVSELVVDADLPTDDELGSLAGTLERIRPLLEAFRHEVRAQSAAPVELRHLPPPPRPAPPTPQRSGT